MGLKSGFFNSKDGDRKYSALDFGSIFDGIIEDGVYAYIGERFKVTPTNPPSMSVKVGTGRGWFNHAWVYIDNAVTQEISAAEVQLDRVDTLVFDIDHREANRRVAIRVIKGTPDRNPVPVDPATLPKDANHKQVPIAQIRVYANQGSIQEGAIHNIVTLTNEGGPPLVTAPLQKIDASVIYADIEAQWNSFYSDANNQLEQISRLYNNVNTVYYQYVNDFQRLYNDYNSMLQQKYRDYESSLEELLRDYDEHANQQLNTLVQSVTTRTNQIIANTTNQLNQIITDTTNQLNQIIRTTNLRADELIIGNENRFNNFISTNQERFEDFLQLSDRRFQKYMYDHNKGFNEFVDLKDAQFNEKMDEWNESFYSFWTDFKHGIAEYLEAQKDMWETWFQYIQGQLSNDAATNLQREIDALCFCYIFAERLVLGITASAIHERVLFGTYGSCVDERAIISAPIRDSVRVFGDKAVLGIVATVLKNVVTIGIYGGTTGERVIIESPSTRTITSNYALGTIDNNSSISQVSNN